MRFFLLAVCAFFLALPSGLKADHEVFARADIKAIMEAPASVVSPK